MKTLVRYRASLVAGVVCGAVALAVTAPAHPATDFYKAKWRSGVFAGLLEDRKVEWRFVKNFPKGAPRARVRDAIADWNGVTGMRFVYQKSRPDYPFVGSSCGTYQQDRVAWVRFDGDKNTDSGGGKEPLGVLTPCWTNDAAGVYSFILKINRDYPWYSKQSGAVPGSRVDLWSVAGHELGHATGFAKGGPTYNIGHFPDQSTACPMNKERQTLCESIVRGTSWARKLGRHDKHTFGKAYP